jgi:hypothetical protein
MQAIAGASSAPTPALRRRSSMTNTRITRSYSHSSQANADAERAAGQAEAVALLGEFTRINADTMQREATVERTTRALHLYSEWSSAKQGGFAHVIGDWLATAAGGACYDLERYAQLVRAEPEAFGRDS